ncbi:MAG: TonB-dependent receptor [Acidobacteriia bacterium]|nr:TonB-dependent receptor [Terriglobia bacterium]
MQLRLASASLLFTVFLLPNSGLAQSVSASISGTVMDPGGRAVFHARVQLQPTLSVAFTDTEGQFSFTHLEAGEYVLLATSADFEETSVRIHLEQAAVSMELRFARLRISHVQMDVIGNEPEIALQEIPGSASLISREELALRLPQDANEVLRSIPGVHIREDSGPVGMRLNVGIRGLNPDRSRSLLVLEDGVPLALAPYGEPEMYYSPPVERMSRIELLKGSGSIAHGPQTIGGVLNFITHDPPQRQQGTLELAGGQRGFFLGQASYGGTKDNTGWYVNLMRKQGDGWRSLYYGINDLTAKLNTALSDRQKLGFKLNLYTEASNSTYLGLTEPQYRRNANDNAVPADFLAVRRYAASLQHHLVLSPRAVLSSSGFAYTTKRNWRRQDFDRAPAPGARYLSIAGDPSIAGGAVYLRNSSGNNNREFDVAGLESRLGMEHRLFGLHARMEAGMRYVYEEHRDQRIDGSTHTASSGVIREDEVRNGGGLSGFVQDRIFFHSRFSITPGLRLERYAYERHILRQRVNNIPMDVDIRKGDVVTKPIPGLGAAFQPVGSLTVFAGVHRGFAPPRVKDAITRAGTSLLLDAESSWNYEAGMRWRHARGIRMESTFFTTDFQNQIIPASQSGGASTTLINGGETLHQGIEFSVTLDWPGLTGRATGMYTEVRYTWLPVAQFTNGIYNGNRLPYAPENNVSFLTGYRHRKGFSVHVDGTRAGSQFADNLQTIKPSGDGTIGLVPSYWVWNLSAGREFKRERITIQPYITVKNLTDELYISSRAPQGIQPGMFRQMNGGMKFRF